MANLLRTTAVLPHFLSLLPYRNPVPIGFVARDQNVCALPIIFLFSLASELAALLLPNPPCPTLCILVE
jgi:hypothetical protein